MDYKSFFDSDDYVSAKAKKASVADTGFFSGAAYSPAVETAKVGTKDECGPLRSPETNSKVSLAMPLDREGLPLAIAYVPMQAWRDIYDVEVAITRATVFKELDKPFYFEEVKNRGR